VLFIGELSLTYVAVYLPLLDLRLELGPVAIHLYLTHTSRPLCRVFQLQLLIFNANFFNLGPHFLLLLARLLVCLDIFVPQS
jgi:hypothetical protein